MGAAALIGNADPTAFSGNEFSPKVTPDTGIGFKFIASGDAGSDAGSGIAASCRNPAWPPASFLLFAEVTSGKGL